MSESTPIIVGYGDGITSELLPKMGNRHGLITGATGTGKSVTLTRLAEGFSQIGVPVFMADVKGDLAGLSQIGGGNAKVDERVKTLNIADFAYDRLPAIYWDLYGQQGAPIRATISDMGPLLLGRLLDLNDTQTGVLNLAFKLADDEGLLLLDMKDLRSMLSYVSENAKELQATYGNVSSASVGAIQRSLLALEQQGADQFFGEPSLALSDLMRTDNAGNGFVSILAADKLMQNPRLYATFLLWLLSELFETMPEVGDLDQPKLVFFFDEAHLLFNDAPKALVDKVEQVVRLIRSKGVGVYFVSQSPIDIPDIILGQLGNRIQHALRAFTPRDQKAVKSAAETFRPNPKYDTAQVIMELGVGEALVSMLDSHGAPTMVEKVFVRPPGVRLGPLTPEERQTSIDHSPIQGKYEECVDRQSAFEMLQAKAQKAADDAHASEVAQREQQMSDREEQELSRRRTYSSPTYRTPSSPSYPRPAAARRSDSVVESMAKSVARSAGSQIGRCLIRGVLGSLFKGR